ncbi:MAG: hypothetical protein MSG64_15515 [Pyrinomonadaceae bacterium MAG19_C2-C3]|nr:hypothetical protein [Pyrinomonadaceae bacterium MAG19_C2-C3]
MRQATPELLELARRLLAHEAKQSRPRGNAAAMKRACERLSEPVNSLVGAGGLRALVARALYLAKQEFAWLEGVKADETAVCSFSNLDEATAGQPADEASRGTAQILANIIWLLVTFIGDDIVLRLVHETWSDVPLGEAAKSGGEETK